MQYTGDPTYDTVLSIGFVCVALVALASIFIPSPYGRFANEKLGFRLNPRLGWFLMELPAPLSFSYFFLTGTQSGAFVPRLFYLVWLLHYANRAFLFPYLMRVPKGSEASFGVLVVGIGWIATTTHGYLNGAFIGNFAEHMTLDWLRDPRFLVGIALYYSSFAGNLWSDSILRNLRTPEEVERGERVYRLPQGGLFQYVTNPSYFTELTGWLGFALATWSLGGVFIFGLSLANLVPRAVATHRWYQERFPDYPRERKILVPFVW